MYVTRENVRTFNTTPRMTPPGGEFSAIYFTVPVPTIVHWEILQMAFSKQHFHGYESFGPPKQKQRALYYHVG